MIFQNNDRVDEEFGGPVIQGTSQSLEKEYLRLTGPPDPTTVRPEPVLKLALTRVKKLWRNKEKDYLYIWNQLKSIRQDMMVEHIKNDFTVDVYQCHARIALEANDINEYNQCQTQLFALYKDGLKGDVDEFISYRILYFELIHSVSGINYFYI